MSNSQLTVPAGAGELREDGVLVVSKTEKPNGTLEAIRFGLLRVRGEREPREISYADYAKLASFYATQERLIKDRKHVMVTLSTGALINTADITSLELQDGERFVPLQPKVPEKLQELPTRELLLEMDGTLISKSTTQTVIRGINDRHFLIARCHYRTAEDGTSRAFTKLEQIPEAHEMIPQGEYAPAIKQIYKYGIPQLLK